MKDRPLFYLRNLLHKSVLVHQQDATPRYIASGREIATCNQQAINSLSAVPVAEKSHSEIIHQTISRVERRGIEQAILSLFPETYPKNVKFVDDTMGAYFEVSMIAPDIDGDGFAAVMVQAIDYGIFKKLTTMPFEMQRYLLLAMHALNESPNSPYKNMIRRGAILYTPFGGNHNTVGLTREDHIVWNKKTKLQAISLRNEWISNVLYDRDQLFVVTTAGAQTCNNCRYKNRCSYGQTIIQYGDDSAEQMGMFERV